MHYCIVRRVTIGMHDMGTSYPRTKLVVQLKIKYTVKKLKKMKKDEKIFVHSNMFYAQDFLICNDCSLPEY